MTTLKLISIECKRTEDITGADNPYLRIKGIKVWEAKMNDEQSKDLGGVPAIDFSGRARITLMEGDAGYFDDDDDLGTTYAYKSMAGKGVQEHHFTGDGAHYILTFEVI